MANLAVLGSFKVNGVAELHSQLVQTTILKDFVDFYGREKFGNITNGITPRRWLDQCNPGLSALITETIGGDKNAWLKDLFLLKGLIKFEDDKKFQEKWFAVKKQNKERLARELLFVCWRIRWEAKCLPWHSQITLRPLWVSLSTPRPCLTSKSSAFTSTK